MRERERKKTEREWGENRKIYLPAIKIQTDLFQVRILRTVIPEIHSLNRTFKKTCMFCIYT